MDVFSRNKRRKIITNYSDQTTFGLKQKQLTDVTNTLVSNAATSSRTAKNKMLQNLHFSGWNKNVLDSTQKISFVKAIQHPDKINVVRLDNKFITASSNLQKLIFLIQNLQHTDNYTGFCERQQKYVDLNVNYPLELLQTTKCDLYLACNIQHLRTLNLYTDNSNLSDVVQSHIKSASLDTIDSKTKFMSDFLLYVCGFSFVKRPSGAREKKWDIAVICTAEYETLTIDNKSMLVKGIAELLFDKIEKNANNNSIESLTLEAVNMQVRSIYEKMGFVCSDNKKTTMMPMNKSLKSDQCILLI